MGADVINLRDTEYEETDGENEGGRKELYALWQTANYYISVDLDGGRIPAKDYVIVVDKEGNPVNVSANPDTNYVVEDPSGNTQETGISSEIHNNPVMIAYNSYFSLLVPSKPGYSFKGWSIWNMDDTEHIIGSYATNERTYQTEESYFYNLTAVANDTVYFKAIWEMNEL